MAKKFRNKIPDPIIALKRGMKWMKVGKNPLKRALQYWFYVVYPEQIRLQRQVSFHCPGENINCKPGSKARNKIIRSGHYINMIQKVTS